MLYLIGLGLGDAKDITVKGLEVVRRCSRVYLEAYTSVLTVGKEALVGAWGSAASRDEAAQQSIFLTLNRAELTGLLFKPFKTHPLLLKHLGRTRMEILHQPSDVGNESVHWLTSLMCWLSPVNRKGKLFYTPGDSYQNPLFHEIAKKSSLS